MHKTKMSCPLLVALVKNVSKANQEIPGTIVRQVTEKNY